MTVKDKMNLIIDLLGGKENINSYTTCTTRLRFNLKDNDIVNSEEIKKIEGVLGSTYQSGQYQVIIGTNVREYYDELDTIIGNSKNKESERTEHNKIGNNKKKSVVSSFFDVLTSCFSPIIPAFSAAGMLKVVLLSVESLGLVSGTNATLIVFNNISDVAFYFLPILMAVSTAKRFKVNEGLAVIVAGSLLYPGFVEAVSSGTQLSIFGINIPMFSYSSTIFPALLGVILLSYIYNFFDKIITYGPIKLLVVPLLSICVTVPLVYLVAAPLGNWGSNLIGGGIEWMFVTMGPLAGLVIGFFYPFLVLTGLHQGISAIQIMEVSTYGYTLALAIALFHNFAEAGTAFGVSFASKDSKMKSIATETGITAFIGVTEPALYSVMVNDKFAMLSAMIGCATGGFFSMLFGVRGFAYVWPNLFSIPSFVGPNSPLIAVLGTLAITMIVSFVMPFIFVKTGLTDFKKN